MTISISSSGPADERRELVARYGDQKPVEVVPGIELCPLVGGFSGARNLFTAVLTLKPSGSLPLYARPFTEALVLLEGNASVEVEDRRYRLSSLDAVTIREQVPRRLVNLSADRPAVLHVSLAASFPEQTWLNGLYTATDQPQSSTGHIDSERICRSDPSARFDLAPQARFQNLFGADLGARGICGGYGRFESGARLPCHRHDFDESITIVEGTATCVVEGSRYELAGYMTALVPQGRCHYFINLTGQPMAMIWVYAGDHPDRIVVDERLCHPDGSVESRK
jgi:quercetin dioxygenase-like cupin family protein